MPINDDCPPVECDPPVPDPPEPPIVVEYFPCLDLVDVMIPCEEQEGIIYFLDDLGISLARSALQADERYITGRNMVRRKIEMAKRDVISHLTKNVLPDCNLNCDESGLIYQYREAIAKAVWYRAGALIFKDLVLDSLKHNEYIAYSADKAVMNVLLLDSSFAIMAQFAGFEHPSNTLGLYQLELQQIEFIRQAIQDYCCKDCTGSSYQIVLP